MSLFHTDTEFKVSPALSLKCYQRYDSSVMTTQYFGATSNSTANLPAWLANLFHVEHVKQSDMCPLL